MSGIFRFKQFDVEQSGCSMKINTDGVLLGAMAMADKPQRILDIGTGTGVIALMLAQRFTVSKVVAVEIDPQAAETARYNFDRSPFARRLSCHTIDLAEFKPSDSYDLIVSNPPYFLNALKNPDARKSMARHADWPFFELLLGRAKDWISESGSLQLVLPITMVDELCKRAEQSFELACQWRIDIYSFENELPIRSIVALGKQTMGKERQRFVIYESKGRHGADYRALLKDFFLAF